MEYGIKVEYYYYAGTFNAPKSGYLKDMDGCIIFKSKSDALEYLASQFGEIEECSDGTYIQTGEYYLSHGEYARPSFTVISNPCDKKLYEIDEDIDMGWCQAWISDEDESKYIICLEGHDIDTKRILSADDFYGYHCVSCNKCPDRFRCEAMDVRGN